MTDTIELIDRAEIKDGQAIVAYTRTQAAVAELRQKYQGAKYDLTTTAGDKAARAGRLELVTLRNDLEKKRKQLKAPALEFGKKVDSEAARLTAEIVALEDPIDAQIKADEQRRETERRAKEEAEAARRKVHTDAIAKIAGYVALATDLPAARIGAGITFLEGMGLSGFEEFTGEATETRDRTVAALRAMQIKAQAREDEAARLEAERIEQARIAAEQAETARQLKAQQDEIERQKQELAEAQAKLQREQAAREAEERRQRAAAEEAERQRIAAAEAEQRRQDEAAARQAREQIEAAERRAEQATITHANGAPMFGEHIKDNGDHVMLDDQGKRSVFCDIDEGDDPAPATATATVHPMPTRAPAPVAGPPTMTLSQIKAHIAPFTIDAAGLEALGFPPAGREGAAKLYHHADLARILQAGIGHLAAVREQLVKAA